MALTRQPLCPVGFQESMIRAFKWIRPESHPGYMRSHVSILRRRWDLWIADRCECDETCICWTSCIEPDFLSVASAIYAANSAGLTAPQYPRLATFNGMRVQA